MLAALRQNRRVQRLSGRRLARRESTEKLQDPRWHVLQPKQPGDVPKRRSHRPKVRALPRKLQNGPAAADRTAHVQNTTVQAAQLCRGRASHRCPEPRDELGMRARAQSAVCLR